MKNTLETDLNKIFKLSKKREKDNTGFRIFLKGEDSKKVDKIVHQLEKEISHQIDCKECANCCKKLHPALGLDDIKVLSGIKKMSENAFKSKYVEKDPYDQSQYLKHTSCIFLNDKVCSIYEHRPETCRSYPNLHKSDFSSRSLGMMESYAICPIVFNVIERLKLELNYRIK